MTALMERTAHTLEQWRDGMTAEAAEDWRPVVGWEGYYSVSSLGRMRSEPRVIVLGATGVRQSLRGRVLKQGGHTGGYLIVVLCRAGNPETHLVHKLVLTAFAGERPKGMEVRHLNGIPADNRRSNLAWGTPIENAADCEIHGTRVRGTSVGNSKLSEAQVLAIRADKRFQHEIAPDYGISQTMVSHIKLGKAWGWLT